MKLFNKLALVATMAVGIGLTSCQQEEYTYEVGAPAAQDSAVVYFADNFSNVVLPLTDSTFQVAVARYATEAATYNLNVTIEEGVDGNIIVPETVTFDEGDLDTTITVSVKDITLMQSYTVKIAIDEAWVNPYEVGSNTVLSLNVKREDFAPYVEGTYVDYFLYGPEAPYAQVMEYSPATDTYRIQDCWGMGGGNLLFSWENDTVISVQTKTIATGYVHSSYGMVSANYLNDQCKAVVQGNMVQMQFMINWTVAAGSFGEYPNFFIFEKPNAEATEQE